MQPSEHGDCESLLTNFLSMDFSDPSHFATMQAMKCILGFPGAANSNNSMKNVYKKLFIFFFTKTTLHDLTSNERDCNFDPGTRSAWFVHKSLYSVLLSCRAKGGISLGNVWNMTQTCIECGPGPTQLLMCHMLLFPLLTSV